MLPSILFKLFLIISMEFAELSIKSTSCAPLDILSIPKAPVPANKSITTLPGILN